VTPHDYPLVEVERNGQEMTLLWGRRRRSLGQDPYATQRAGGNDGIPHYRRNLDRASIIRVSSRHRHTFGALNRNRRQEILATTRAGTEYVIAAKCTDEEASDIVNELRAHLELATGPISVSEADRDEALSELHDAVTDYRKGPTILPEDFNRLQD